MAYISDQAETDATSLYAITHAVGAVVRHLEGCHHKITDGERHILLYEHAVRVVQPRRDTIVAPDALVHQFCRIDLQAILRNQLTHRLDMICMIMSDENGKQLGNRQVKGLEMTLQRLYPKTRINKYTPRIRPEVIPVSAASTS